MNNKKDKTPSAPSKRKAPLRRKVIQAERLAVAEPALVPIPAPEIVIDVPPQKLPILQRTKCWCIESVAVIFWLYVAIKLFVFDIDRAVVATIAPTYVRLLDFKFVLLIALLAFSLIFIKRTSITKFVAFVLFYPFIVLFWRLPVSVYKSDNWLLPFAIVNTFVSIFRSFRFYIVSISFWLIFFVLALTTSRPALLVIAVCCLVLSVSASYVKKFVNSFSPNSNLGAYRKVATVLHDHVRNTYALNDELRQPRKDFSEDQTKRWSTNLEASLLFNRASLFFARRLREYQSSSFEMASRSC